MILAQAPGADAVGDDAEAFDLLAHDLDGVDQGGQHHDGRAVLVVVEAGMSRSFFSRSSISKHRGAEISSRFMPPNTGDRFLGLDYRVRILGVEADRERVHVRELLEERRLALHHGHGGPRPYVPEPEDGRTVGDDGDRVALW